jgi:aconitate hydratase 2/2-methylisocitrate dehydratase
VLESYRQHVAEREAEGLPPLALDADQVAELVELIKNPPAGEGEFLVDLLVNRVPPGVDQAAYVKAAFLADVAKANISCDLIDAVRATEILGTMLGGYNIQPLIDLLDIETTADAAAKALSHTLLVYDAFHDVAEKSKTNDAAAHVIRSWADAEWFTSKPELAKEITVTVYKVPGETNTDDLSPATEAWSRPDIPLHAKSMLVTKMDKPLETIEDLKKKGHPIAYVGDVVGTGSSRKSAINSVLWHMGLF